MSEKNIGKAREIFDAKIQFVSLVDAAANKRKFLMTKAKDGTCSFVNYGRILKADAESHYVTGIVYEPLTEDTDGEFMTAEEIRKAAYYYVKNFENVDIQHSFEPEKNCAVVESWIAKADFSIGNEQVKEGTWLMTVEVTDDALWEKIAKGEITGFSMGGVCTTNEEEVDLADVEKQAEDKPEIKETNKGILTKFAEFLGFNVVEKGSMAELYEDRSRSNNFWTAFDSLQDSLRHYDYVSDRYIYETDEAKIEEALEDFGKIISGLLSGTKSLAKAIEGPESPTAKADDPEVKEAITKKEDETVTKAEVEEIVAKSVAEALGKSQGQEAEAEADKENQQTQPVEKSQEPSDEISAETIAKMVAEAVEKAKEEQEQAESGITMEDVHEMIAQEVAKAMEPIRKANHLPSNLNHIPVGKNGNQPEEHYLHGIL